MQLQEYIADKYAIPSAEHINLDKVIEYEELYLKSPKAKVDQILDKLEERRRNWRE